MQTSEAVVAMTAMLVSFGLPLVVIAIVLYYKHLRNRMRQELLGHEIERLVALQQVNRGVRDEEITFFRDRLAQFEAALEHARLRLDAVRVIVAT